VLLTSSWRTPASSSSRAQGAPPSNPPAPPWCPRTPPPITRWREHPRPRRALAPRPPPRPVVTGLGDSTSLRGPPPRSLPPLPCLPTMSSSVPTEGRVPITHAVGTLHHIDPGAPAARASSPLRAPPAPCSGAAWRGQPIRPGTLAGSTTRRARSPSVDESCQGPHQHDTRT
jgi:hypothetical protein